MKRPGSQTCSYSSQRCSNGLSLALCTGHSSSFTPSPTHPCFYGTGAQSNSHVGRRRGHPETVPTKLENLSESSFHQKWRSEPKSWTTPHHTSPSSKLYNWQDAIKQVLLSWQPRFLQAKECDLLLWEPVSSARVQWQHTFHHCISSFALYLVMHPLSLHWFYLAIVAIVPCYTANSWLWYIW